MPFSTTVSHAHRTRTGHACNRCRLKRTKCSGDDRCSECARHDAECTYGDRMKETRNKSLARKDHSIQQLTQCITALVSALTDVLETLDLSSAERQRMEEILAQAAAATGSESNEVEISPSFAPSQLIATSASVLSSGDDDRRIRRSQTGVRPANLQHLVHLDNGSGMTGYIGEMSEMSWLQCVRDRLALHPREAGNDQAPSSDYLDAVQAYDLGYFMDQEDLLAVDEEQIDADQLPPEQTAFVLAEAYFHAVQGSFPFIGRERLLTLIDQLLAVPSRPSWARRKLLALANMAWAVGAKWLQMTNLAGDRLGDDHLKYYARARSLGVDHRILPDHPDLETMQAVGMLGLYLLLNGSVQRSVTTQWAWAITGQLGRLASALGLHLRLTMHNVDATQSMQRSLLWCSFVEFEILLSEITGRPKCVALADFMLDLDNIPQQHHCFASTHNASIRCVACDSRAAWAAFLGIYRGVALQFSGGDVPWDRLVPVGNEVPSGYLAARLGLSKIHDEIARYTYLQPSSTWQEHELVTLRQARALREWNDALEEELRILPAHPTTFDPRPRLGLALYYQSMKILLYQPFLSGRLDAADDRARTVSHGFASACVEAALQQLRLLPDRPISSNIYQVISAWSLLHNVVQAVAVLLLELSMNMRHTQGRLHEMLAATAKALEYLRALSVDSKSAYKAWNICSALSRKVAGTYGNPSLLRPDLEASQPHSWTCMDGRMLKAVMWTLQAGTNDLS